MTVPVTPSRAVDYLTRTVVAVVMVATVAALVVVVVQSPPVHLKAAHTRALAVGEGHAGHVRRHRHKVKFGSEEEQR